MKKIIVTIVGLMFCIGLATANAATKKTELTAEQQKDKQALIEKYDADKNGKLSAKEQKAMTQEDKDKWAILQGKAAKPATTKPAPKATTPAAPAAPAVPATPATPTK
jgi:hypothetical protein